MGAVCYIEVVLQMLVFLLQTHLCSLHTDGLHLPKSAPRGCRSLEMSHRIPPRAADVTCHGVDGRERAEAVGRGWLQGWGAHAGCHPCTVTVTLLVGNATSFCSAPVDRGPQHLVEASGPKRFFEELQALNKLLILSLFPSLTCEKGLNGLLSRSLWVCTSQRGREKTPAPPCWDRMEGMGTPLKPWKFRY